MNLYLKFFFILILGIAVSLNSTAQNAKYNFENLTSDEGYRLPISGNIVQDKQGYIWFPAFDGLYRYDGYEFKKYEHKNSDPFSLSFNTITALFADHDGTIWAGSFGGGLNHLEPYTGKCTIYKTVKNDTLSLGGDRISVIYRDSENRLWVATPGKDGLCVFDDKKKTFDHIRLGEPSASEEMKLKCNHVYGILEDRDKDLFFSTWDGLFIRDHITGEYSIHRCDTNYMRDRNNCMGALCLDDQGIIWITTWGGGLKCFNKKTGIFQSYIWNKKAGISHTNNICKGILTKSDHELWVAILDSKGYGPLAIFNTKEKTFSFIKHDPKNPKSIPENQGAGLFKDKDGHVWLTNGNNGVSRLDLNKQELPFENLNLESFENSPPATVTSCWKDTTQQLLFIGTTWSDGLYYMDLKTRNYSHITDRYTTKGESVNIQYAKNKLLYLSGETLKVLNVTGKNISLFDPQPPSEVSKLTEDKKGNLWGISSGSILLFESEKKSWKTIPVYNEKSSSRFNLHGLVIYKDGTLWTGSDENGIFIIDPVTLAIRNIRKSADKNGLPFNTIICMCADLKGRIWCGGIGGIVIYDPSGNKDNFYAISSENGLASDYINELAIDRQGFIWASTLSGLTKIDPQNFSLINYESLSGIFKNPHLTSLDISDDNEIFAGSEMGFTHFYPEQLKKDLKKPEIAIGSFKIFDKEYPLPLSEKNEKVKLAYNQNYFSFEFAALTFSDVSKNQYAYMLEGFDKDWIHAGIRRYAAYTNIQGGDYVFHVKASNKDGVWNEAGISIPIFISTPWWKTYWFYFLLAIGFSGSVFAIYLYRVRQLKAIFAIRNNLAADLHDEVGSSLSNIRLLSEMLPSMDPSGKEKNSSDHIVAQIRENARGTLEGMYDIIWNLNPNNDQLEFLLSRLKEQTVPLAESKNIILQWDLTSLNKSVKLPLEKRKDLYLSCKEAIQNALKYSECSNLVLKAKEQYQNITITIYDNGKGFGSEFTDGGNGLVNMKQRMERWKGRCEISTSEKGTSICLSLPL